MNQERGTGRTFQQLRDAPRDAVFVWCNDWLDYARDLAKHIGRVDIKIVSASSCRAGHLRGINSPVVIDHAFE